MSPQESAAVHHHEIEHLAYLNWKRDGCPHGRDQEYWYEAEHQLKATKDLMMAEHQPSTGGNPGHGKAVVPKSPARRVSEKAAAAN